MSTESSLAQSNSSTLGGNFPVVTLPDGSQVPTGTVGALLVHIRRYNACTDPAEKKALEQQIRASLPTLIKVGMFELFSPDEWLSDAGQGSPGRKIIGIAAKEAGVSSGKPT